jgi:hypothetical protein
MPTFHLTATDHESASYAIKQGATFDFVAFYYEENLSTWTPRGQIRDNYADKNGTIQASFSFDPLVFGPVTIDGITKNYTKVKPILSATETRNLTFNLKTRSSASDIVTPGKNVWVYDIELESPGGIVRRDIQGWVEVSSEVTR